MSRPLLLAPVLLLVACSPEPASDNRATPSAAAIAASPSPRTQATPSAAVAPEQSDEVAQIPAEFGGLWALEGSSCTPHSDGRLEVTADTLRFYDSSATPHSVQIERQGKARLDLSFESGSEIWRELAEFELIDGGKRLQQTTRDTKMLYTRCSNESAR